MTRQLLSPLVLFMSFLSACGTEAVDALPPVVFERVEQALTDENGRSLNGRNLNGRNLNGTDLTGFLVGTDFANVVMSDGQGLDSLRLEATRFVGARGARSFQGEDFLHARFQGRLGDGGKVQLRIEGIAPAPAPNADLTTYYITVLWEDGVWRPACVDNEGVGVNALPVNGRWDYRQGVVGGGAKLDDPSTFTFACMGAAIAKCTLWGYRPWATVNGVSLAPYHQACTRMTRADFCGDGATYTQDGRLINLYDNVGIQQDTEAWMIESAWGPNGPTCVGPYNRSTTSLCHTEATAQSCSQDAPFSSQAILVLEIPPT